MSTLFLGWDVGAWNCDGGKSRDALCALSGKSIAGLSLVGAPRRGNLREVLVEGALPSGLLEWLRVGETGSTTATACLAIDTPLGWPAAFHGLLQADGLIARVPDKVDANPYVFRHTEQALVQRGLFPKGRTPLSAVRDMIGSQSTKGIYFLKKAQLAQTKPGVWMGHGWIALETYPTPVRTSASLQPHFDRIAADARFVEAVRVGRNVAADITDALWCALVAATFVLAPDLLAAPSARREVASEGWIWTPSDCGAATDLSDEEMGAD